MVRNSSAVTSTHIRLYLYIAGGAGAAAALFSAALVCTYGAPKTAPRLAPLPAQFSEPALFTDALARARTTSVATTTTGLIVPHHLLASALMARVYTSAAATQPELVLVMSPDHYNLGTTHSTVSLRDFNTVFGRLTTDDERAQQLIAAGAAQSGEWFYREHGIGAQLPFIKHFFPRARVIALAIKEHANKAELDALVAELKRILPARTLVVQSTDFSHYLTAATADKMDNETLAALQAGEATALLQLSQPSHIDSSAALYIQARLQAEFFGSRLQIVEHQNSQSYTHEPLEKTTSYITAMYNR